METCLLRGSLLRWGIRPKAVIKVLSKGSVVLARCESRSGLMGVAPQPWFAKPPKSDDQRVDTESDRQEGRGISSMGLGLIPMVQKNGSSSPQDERTEGVRYSVGQKPIEPSALARPSGFLASQGAPALRQRSRDSSQDQTQSLVRYRRHVKVPKSSGFGQRGVPKLARRRNLVLKRFVGVKSP